MKRAKALIATLAILAVAASAAFAGDKKPHKPPQKSEKDSKWSLSLGFGSEDFGIFGGFDGRHLGGRIIIGRPRYSTRSRLHYSRYDSRYRRRRDHRDYRYDRDRWDRYTRRQSDWYEVWVPGHWEIVIESRYVPGRYEEVWVSDGGRHHDGYYYKDAKGKVRSQRGHYEKRWVAGKTVKEEVKKWVAGGYEKKSGKAPAIKALKARK